MDQQTNPTTTDAQFEQDFVQSVQNATTQQETQKAQKKASFKKWGLIGGAGLLVLIAVVVILIMALNNQESSSDYFELSCKNSSASMNIKYTTDEIISLESTNIPLSQEDKKTAASIHGASYVVDELEEWFKNNTTDAICETK